MLIPKGRDHGDELENSLEVLTMTILDAMLQQAAMRAAEKISHAARRRRTLDSKLQRVG